MWKENKDIPVRRRVRHCLCLDDYSSSCAQRGWWRYLPFRKKCRNALTKEMSNYNERWLTYARKNGLRYIYPLLLGMFDVCTSAVLKWSLILSKYLNWYISENKRLINDQFNTILFVWSKIFVIENCIKTIVFISLFCGRAAKMCFHAASPHVQKQLRHSRNEKCIDNFTLKLINSYE